MRACALRGRSPGNDSRSAEPCRWTHLDRISLPDKRAGRTWGRIHPWSASGGVADRGACWPADSRTDWKPMASGTSKAGTRLVCQGGMYGPDGSTDTAPGFENRYPETCLAERLRAREPSNSSSDHHNLSNPFGHAFSAT